MADERRLLFMRHAAAAPPPEAFRRPATRPASVSKARRIEIVGPMFEALATALPSTTAATSADGASPDFVLVMATTEPIALIEALATVPGLESIGELREDFDADADFYLKDDDGDRSDKPVPTNVYLVMSNQEALGQLLSLWKQWSTRSPAQLGSHRAWTPVFSKLRQIRRWGPEDRMQEAGSIAEFEELVSDVWFGQTTSMAEIELWPTADPDEAERRVRRAIADAGGEVAARSFMPEIAYHALLARIPQVLMRRLIELDLGVELVHNQAIQFLRPAPQVRTRRSHASAPPQLPVAQRPAPGTLRAPVVALLDGLPIENHPLLDGRLVVDDPDEWGALNPVQERGHGTAMASIIIHGDLSADRAAATHRLYVRPVLRSGRDAPTEELWADVIRRAVEGLVADDGGGGAGVTVVNLSIGDLSRPFHFGRMSPLARLLDWLAFRHRLLFIVSAGNSHTVVNAPTCSERDVLRSVRAKRRMQRILSPAEAINALTVGASHDDSSNAPVTGLLQPLVTPALPAPYSRLGSGFRRAVKPEVLAPGGKVLFEKTEDGFESAKDRLRLGPGIQAACPPHAPLAASVSFTTGTSNAAAMLSRYAMLATDALGAGEGHRPEVDQAVLLKALLVNSAGWPLPAREALRGVGWDRQVDMRDALGYGVVDANRFDFNTPNRVTLVGGRTLSYGACDSFVVPIPAELNARTALRRLSVTLAWLSPINPASHRYRCAKLQMRVDPREILAVEARDLVRNPHGAQGAATVQHEVYEGSGTALVVGADSKLDVQVECLEDAADSVSEGIPYAVAVTLEVSGLDVHALIRNRLRVPIRL